MMSEIIQIGTGRMSNFGGPRDMGVATNEGLALIEESDLDYPWFGHLFLPGTDGLARRLNPDLFYLACRWDYKVTPRSLLRHSMCSVISEATGEGRLARPVDWGPNERLDRIADLSPGLCKALGLATNDRVRVELITP